MPASQSSRAAAAARSTVSPLGLAVDDTIVLRDANRLVVRLMPCDVVVRIAPVAYQASAALEVELARQLAAAGSPVALLHPRVAQRVHRRDGFVMNMWTYYEPVPPEQIRPTDYAAALGHLHAGMRQVDLTTPHFTDRVAEAERIIRDRRESPALVDADRELLGHTLRTLKQSVGEGTAAEQLLHGEPHPWNLLGTTNELVFIDLETGCRGPVEFDLAHVPDEVCTHYPGADSELVRECRGLVLAMVAAWRWRRGDNHPDGRREARKFLSAVRDGPPWPTLDVMNQRSDHP